MAKTVKGLKSEVTKLKEQIAKAKAKATAAKAKAAAKKAKADAAKSAKKAKIATKKKRQVFSAGEWTGAKPKKLTIYKVRLMLDEQQIGVFGPYATIRAASADAKNILRMHVGPGFKIEEIGVDEPVLRSDGRVKAYFHPSIYSAQGTDKGVLTAQVIEQGGEAQRTKTFVKKYNPAKRALLRVGDTVRVKLKRAGRSGGLPRSAGGGYVGTIVSIYADGGFSVDFHDGSEGSYRDNEVSRVSAKKANPHVSFKTRSGQVISFDAKRRNPGPFASMEEVKAANIERGGHFFDRKTMQFFASKVEAGPYGGRFFVTSEKTGPDSRTRAYTVRRVEDDGIIRTVGSMGDYATKAKAVAHAKQLGAKE